MSFRSGLSLFLLVAAFAAERFAYYGTRSFLTLAMSQTGMVNRSQISTLMTLGSVLVLLGTFAGAGAAYAVGPRLTAVIATFLSALGILAVGSMLFTAGALLFSFGAGMVRVCPLVAAAEMQAEADGPGAPSPRRFAVLTAFAFFVQAAVNLAANTATSASGALVRMQGFQSAAYFCGAIALLASMLAGVSLAISGLGRGAKSKASAPQQAVYRAGEPPPPMPAAAAPPKFMGLAVVAIVAGLFSASWLFVSPMDTGGASWSSTAALYTVSTTASVFSAYLGFVLWLYAAMTRSTITPIVGFAVGAILVGIGIVPITLGGSSSVVLVALGMAIAGIADPFVDAPLHAYGSLALRGRAAVFGVAVVFAVPQLGSMVATPIVALGPRNVFAILFALVAIGVGVVAAVTARRAQRELFD